MFKFAKHIPCHAKAEKTADRMFAELGYIHKTEMGNVRYSKDSGTSIVYYKGNRIVGFFDADGSISYAAAEEIPAVAQLIKEESHV